MTQENQTKVDPVTDIKLINIVSKFKDLVDNFKQPSTKKQIGIGTSLARDIGVAIKECSEMEYDPNFVLKITNQLSEMQIEVLSITIESVKSMKEVIRSLRSPLSLDSHDEVGIGIW